MQDQEKESFSLDWIESFEFGQEFEEVCINWSTKIAPLWTLINNSLSFHSSFDLPLSSIACSAKQQQQQQQQQTATANSNSNSQQQQLDSLDSLDHL